MLAAETWYEIVLPPVVTLAVFVAAAALLWLARGRLAELVSDLGIKNVSAFGIDLQFAERQTRVAYEHQQGKPPSREDLDDVRDAAQFLAPLAAQSRILWVDDNPGGNLAERALLLAWEVDVEAARSTDEAIRELEDLDPYFDLVVSDWRRKDEGDSEDEPAGVDLLKRMSGRFEQRVIFYHGIVPADELAKRRRLASEWGAVGTTASPGELLRWILLELARVAINNPRPEQRARRDWHAAQLDSPARVERQAG
jgi:hypothetical protein